MIQPIFSLDSGKADLAMSSMSQRTLSMTKPHTQKVNLLKDTYSVFTVGILYTAGATQAWILNGQESVFLPVLP